MLTRDGIMFKKKTKSEAFFLFLFFLFFFLCLFVFLPYILTFCAHVICPVNIVQLRDVINPSINAFCICDYMFYLYK